jgi:hypothetical protein
MRKYRLAAIVAICVLAAVLIYNFVPSASIPDNVAGTLHPENTPTPTNDCMQTAPKDAFFVFMGQHVASFDGGQSQYVLAAGKSGPVLTVQLDKNDLIIKGTVYDIDGKQVAIIEDGSFKEADENGSSIVRSGNSNTLIVKDRAGNELLFLRYLNPHAVEVHGVFPGRSGPEQLTKEADITPQGKVLAKGGCFYSKYNRYAAHSACYANSINGCQ